MYLSLSVPFEAVRALIKTDLEYFRWLAKSRKDSWTVTNTPFVDLEPTSSQAKRPKSVVTEERTLEAYSMSLSLA